jgi:poly [ADP-ribose] polymerase 10/14/15
MVNAANGDLNHIGGVAKAILDAGGEKIQEECDAFVKAEGPLYPGEYFSGSPGKLPCKRLIHAVGPRWDASKRQKICNLLRVTCTRVLEEAKDYRSIALPAIGSGIFGIPKETCAEIMIEAAEKFAQKNPDSALKDIRFVNNDDLTCQVFLKKFRENFLARSTFTDNQTTNYTGKRQPRGSGRERPEVPRSFGSSVSRSRPRENGRKNVETTVEVPPKRTPGDFIVTKRNMKISVVVGDLSTYKVLYVFLVC